MTAAKFRAKFATAGRLAPIENWLNLNITGEWSIKMDSVSDDMAKKNYVLLFDDEGDRDSFALRFTKGQAAYENKGTAKVKQGMFNSLSGLFRKSKS